MFLTWLLLQLLGSDSVYSSEALRDLIAQAASQNRAPPVTLAGYGANIETELALILRDSLGRELVGQIEQVATRATWERNGRYDLHVVGYRSQSAGAPYSALTFARSYTVPTLYGNRIFFGINDGVPRTKRDSGYYRKRATRDSAEGREPLRAIHPLASDRDRHYRFTGGDTVATMYVRDRPIRLVRVHVEPVASPRTNFVAFRGEMDFDAERHQLVRMRGRLLDVSTARNPLLARRTGAVAVAYLEFENAEINGQYWLPAYQRSEFQAQMGLLGDVRPIFRLVSRFRNYRTTDTTIVLAEMDTLPSTRATLTYASKDSVSHYGDWEENLGVASARVTSDDFNDLAPDVWRPTGAPRLDYWPRALEDVARYNRVEGMFTGVSTWVRFRDRAPGLAARGTLGWAWSEQTVRGIASVTLSRGSWITSARAGRELVTTNDFLIALETGLSIFPLFTGTDDADYVDRRQVALSSTRIVGNVDRAFLTVDAAVAEDRSEPAHVRTAVISGRAFRPNRNSLPGRYGRGRVSVEIHPQVTNASLSPGFGARLFYEIARGDLQWQRLEARLAARQYWRGFVVASRLDAGAVFAPVIPPQQLYELGGYADLPSYDYKEFAGDRAALGSALVAYHFPVLRTPRRIWSLVFPGLSPGIGSAVQGGWTAASGSAARQALLALGGDGVTPLSRPTDRIRATADFRLTFMSGALGVGIARAIDQPDAWKPFFGIGLSF